MESSIFNLIMAISFILIIFLLITEELREKERNVWNDGCCSKCKTRWVLIHTDIHGGRGYTCCNGHHCTINCNIDKA